MNICYCSWVLKILLHIIQKIIICPEDISCTFFFCEFFKSFLRKVFNEATSVIH